MVDLEAGYDEHTDEVSMYFIDYLSAMTKITRGARAPKTDTAVFGISG